MGIPPEAGKPTDPDTGPDADLPRFDPSRRVIRCVADAAHVPHLLAQAKLVVDHYADGVGMKAVYKQNAVVLVTDLLDAGASQAVLLRASEAYATASKNATTKPMGPEKFFCETWKEYRRGVPRAKPKASWKAPPGPTPEGRAAAARVFAEAKRRRQEGAGVPTAAPLTPPSAPPQTPGPPPPPETGPCPPPRVTTS